MIPSPTRHVPAPIHPRLFAGGDSHRSQGFLYPWKPYAPPHIPVYCRFVPPPQAAEQTGKRVGTPAMFLPPAAAKTSRECVGECGVAMGPGVKKPQATVLIAYGENAPGAVLKTPRPAPFSSLLHRARSSLDQRHNPTRHSGCAARRPIGPQNGNKPCATPNRRNPNFLTAQGKPAGDPSAKFKSRSQARSRAEGAARADRSDRNSGSGNLPPGGP